jgi:hypothetical protein
MCRNQDNVHDHVSQFNHQVDHQDTNTQCAFPKPAPNRVSRIGLAKIQTPTAQVAPIRLHTGRQSNWGRGYFCVLKLYAIQLMRKLPNRLGTIRPIWCASTCRRATGACGGRPMRSGAIPRPWSRSSCGNARIPSKASAPASASYGSPRPGPRRRPLHFGLETASDMIKIRHQQQSATRRTG